MMEHKMKGDSLNKLPLEDIKMLSPEERSKYYERYLFDIIKKHEKMGLTQSEMEKISGLTFNTLSKYLEVLTSKRKLYRIKKGKAIIYYPNGRIAHSLTDKDIQLKGKRYRIYLIENPEGEQLVYIQEKELDENGFENVVAGITIPKESLYDFTHILKKIDTEKVSLIEED